MTSHVEHEATERQLAAPREYSMSSSCGDAAAAASLTSYQELPRFGTWRKHVRDLYQQLVHVDLVWESCVAQLMPYVSLHGATSSTTTHTILCGTRTNGQEQNFIQLCSAALPSNTHSLDGTLHPFCDATGEVGGYGMFPHTCGLKMERRILHEGDVLAARYMPANPLLLASCSSNGSVYIFDWSRVSLNRYPNDPPRPRAPLPPNELTSEAASRALYRHTPTPSSTHTHGYEARVCAEAAAAASGPTEEEKTHYHRRMRELHAVIMEQDRWDRRRGEGQHVLTLRGGVGASDCVDWGVDLDGWLASGSRGRVCVWRVGNLSKDDARTVDPVHTLALDRAGDTPNAAADDGSGARVTSVKFSWHHPRTVVYASSSGAIGCADLRAPALATMTTMTTHAERPTALALSPLGESAESMLVGCGDGTVRLFDIRMCARAVRVERLHEGEVTSVEWCPHSRHLFASAGEDGAACVFNTTRQTLLFRHLGHTSSVMDLGWNWQEGNAGQLVTVDSNALMLWRPRDYFFYV